ncbi:MAG: hypothetical protein ACE15F_07810 [bacterium]
MSKRQQQYWQGMERICRFLDILLNEGTWPTRSDLEQEIQAIPFFKKVDVCVHFPENIPDPQAGFFFILGEDYSRYDDVLPESLHIFLLSSNLDTAKELDRMLTARAIA